MGEEYSGLFPLCRRCSYTVARIMYDHVDENHQSHDCVLGIAHLLFSLIDLKLFGSTLPIVCDDNQRNNPFELRFEVFAAVRFRIVVARVITPCSLVGGYERFGGRRTRP